MIQELIKITNENDFYQNGNIFLINTKCELGKLNLSEFNFVIENTDNNTQLRKTSYWKIIANNALDYQNLRNKVLLPYVKITILDNHPLLWNYKEDIYECGLKGFPKNSAEFIGDLTLEFEKDTGNWLNLNKFLFSINEYFKKNDYTIISIPTSLKNIFEKICQKHKINFNVENIIKAINKGFEYRPEAKVLIFGNEDVSPNYFNLNQPYIIADSFEAIIAEKT